MKNKKSLRQSSNTDSESAQKFVESFTTLNQEISEEMREPIPSAMERRKNTANWSQGDDRGEDLAEERDPFVQQPERDTEIPPELTQPRPFHLYEQRIALGKFPDNLADLFDEEREVKS